MVIIQKYILKNYLMSFAFCIALLMVIGVIGDILSFLENIFKENIPVSSILAFYFYLGPFAFVHMVPFASLLAAVYVFNSLSKNHEVTAVITSGLSLWTLLKPVMMVTLLFCLATFIVNDRVVPKAMEKAETIRREELESGRDGTGKKHTIRDMTVYGKAGQVIFAKSFDTKENVLTNFILHGEDVTHSVTDKISARLVRWDGAGSWIGEDVIVFRVDTQGNFKAEPEVYRKRKIMITETPEDLRKVQSDPRFMTFVQLRDYLKLLKTGSKETFRRLSVDLNYKLAFPFTALITVLIGVPFSIETGRGNALIGMARGIAIAMLYLPAVAIALALGKGGYIPPVLSAWISLILFALLGMYYVNKKS
jgi:lipopolysaccharide export system permease protein